MVRCFAELHIGRTFSPAWHAEVLAAKLQGVHDGPAKRLVVNVPPRHLKSLAASVALPAWLLGHDPTLAIVNVTYAQDLSDKFARDCRMIMTSDWYQSLFETRLASPREPLAELATTRGGFRLATSVGGVLTGRGADVILIDDPLKPTDAHVAEPPRRRQRLVRLDALFAAQRQAEGRDRHRHAAPARGRSRRPRARPGRLGGRLVSGRRRRGRGARDRDAARPWAFRRSAGEALDPAREPLPALERIRSTIGEMNFAAQYQQRPAPAGGGMVKAAWLQRFRARRPAVLRPHRAELGHRQEADRAFRLLRLHHLGREGPRFYLLDVLRKKLSYPELRRAVIEQDGSSTPSRS